MNKRKKSGKLKFFVVLTILILLVIFSIGAMKYALQYMYPLTYSEYVERYSEEYELDKNLVFSMIKAESGFDANAVSPRNAKGLMQIMDDTGEWAAEKMKITDFEVAQLMEPETNIRIGCWYIARLLKQYEQNTELALAAYNAGSGNVSKWLKDESISKDGRTLDRIPFEETRNYVEKIKKYNTMYKKLYDESK
ncbi:MAG: soluble lytic murein transglycosylase-like protein [Eubacterium sp.]|nr:soluble lytic murein transglycosylase-like protein [Eubacterium sp.]